MLLVARGSGAPSHGGRFMGMRVALSGGVGSGKSTVAALLAGHGAVIIDADAVAREVVEPGAPGFDAVVARFGDRVVADGCLDRPALPGSSSMTTRRSRHSMR